VSPAPRVLWMDNDVLQFVEGKRLWGEVCAWLRGCGFVIGTLRCIYQREMTTAVRERADLLQGEGLLFVANDPDDLPPTRAAAKLRRKIEDAARRSFPVTSQSDRQLLFMLLWGEDERVAFLVTNDRPLQGLAEERGARWYDLLDVLDALWIGGHMSELERAELLGRRPGGRLEAAGELLALLRVRRAQEPMECARGGEGA
jgi:hypothetical protein